MFEKIPDVCVTLYYEYHICWICEDAVNERRRKPQKREGACSHMEGRKRKKVYEKFCDSSESWCELDTLPQPCLFVDLICSGSPKWQFDLCVPVWMWCHRENVKAR